MLTLAEIGRSSDGYLRAPRIDRSEVRLLWYSDYWDGPKSGMLVYRDEECWFQIIDESQDDDADWYRRFVVLRLTPEQHSEEQKWHALFREKVGIHMDAISDQSPDVTSLIRPRAKWHEFYDLYEQRMPPDYSTNEALGWFE